VKQAEEHEKFEKSGSVASRFHRDVANMSELGQARIAHNPTIPTVLESNNYRLVAIKKYKAYSQLVKDKISEQMPNLEGESTAHYFVEVQDKTQAGEHSCNSRIDESDPHLETLNHKYSHFDKQEAKSKIGLVYLGRVSPGQNNIVDGLLRF
jgi:hypothetical protein